MKRTTPPARDTLVSSEFAAGAKFAFAVALIFLGIYLTFHLIVAIIIGIPLIVIGGGLAAKYWPHLKKILK